MAMESKKRSHHIFVLAVIDIAMSSASVELVVTVLCFEAFQSMRPSKSLKQYPFELAGSCRNEESIAQVRRYIVGGCLSRGARSLVFALLEITSSICEMASCEPDSVAVSEVAIWPASETRLTSRFVVSVVARAAIGWRKREGPLQVWLIFVAVTGGKV